VAGLNHSAVIVSPLRCKKIEEKYDLDDKSTPRPIRHSKGAYLISKVYTTIQFQKKDTPFGHKNMSFWASFGQIL
jgi:hypothetical protein